MYKEHRHNSSTCIHRLHSKNCFWEEAKSETASPSLNGSLTSTGREEVEQMVGWVRWVINNFARSLAQPDAIK